MGNYLVTGAAGFIGSVVCEMLLRDNQVVGIDNLNDDYDVRLKEYRLDKLKQHSQFTFYAADISDRILWGDGMRFDAVIHLAAKTGVRVDDPWGYVDSNLTGTLNILELCRSENIPKFVMASTSSVYGDNAEYPTTENATSDRPLQVYAASKKAGEVLAYAYHHLYGLDVSIMRYFTVYGPAGRPDMAMFRFIRQITEGGQVEIYGDGNQSRGFTYVNDIARGTIAGLKPVGYEVFNLGGSETITVNELILLLESAIGKDADIAYLPEHPADMIRNQADASEAKELLDWEAQQTLEDGIGKTVAWYLEERNWAKGIL